MELMNDLNEEVWARGDPNDTTGYNHYRLVKTEKTKTPGSFIYGIFDDEGFVKKPELNGSVGDRDPLNSICNIQLRLSEDEKHIYGIIVEDDCVYLKGSPAQPTNVADKPIVNGDEVTSSTDISNEDTDNFNCNHNKISTTNNEEESVKKSTSIIRDKDTSSSIQNDSGTKSTQKDADDENQPSSKVSSYKKSYKKKDDKEKSPRVIKDNANKPTSGDVNGERRRSSDIQTKKDATDTAPDITKDYRIKTTSGMTNERRRSSDIHSKKDDTDTTASSSTTGERHRSSTKPYTRKDDTDTKSGERRQSGHNYTKPYRRTDDTDTTSDDVKDYRSKTSSGTTGERRRSSDTYTKSYTKSDDATTTSEVNDEQKPNGRLHQKTYTKGSTGSSSKQSPEREVDDHGKYNYTDNHAENNVIHVKVKDDFKTENIVIKAIITKCDVITHHIDLT